MDNKFNKILNNSRKIYLNKEKKGLIKDNLIYFMRNSSVREFEVSRQVRERSLLTIFKFKFMPIFLAIALMFGGGAGAAFAAEGSLPGDVLYGVKQVTEDVRVVLAVGAEAKAKAEARFAERRLEEAAKLVVEGRMDEKKRAELEARFAEGSEHVAARVEAMQAVQAEALIAADISAQFEASIKAHAKVLEAMSAAQTRAEAAIDAGVSVESEAAAPILLIAANASLEPFVAHVRTHETLWEERGREAERNYIEGEVAVEVTLESRLSHMENRIDELEAFLERKKDSIEASVYAEAKARIELARTLVISIRGQMLTAISWDDVNAKLHEIERLIVETRIYINTVGELDIDIKFGRPLIAPRAEVRGRAELREEPGASRDLPSPERSEADLPTAVEVGAEVELRGGGNLEPYVHGDPIWPVEELRGTPLEINESGRLQIIVD